MLRGKKVDEQIILMMEAYLKLYDTLNYSKWKDYGTKESCRMCKLVGIGANNSTDCNKCPLWQDGDYIHPCADIDDTSRELDEVILSIYSKSEQEQRDIIKARIKTLYRILKANGYFN